MSDIDHAEILDELSGLDRHVGWKHLVAHFKQQQDDLLQRMINSVPDEDLPKARAVVKQLSEFSPVEMLENLKQSHASAAAKQAPVVPKPKR